MRETKFYEELFSKHKEYGGGRYDVARLIRTPSFRQWQERVSSRQTTVLDIGCGRGQFLLDLTDSLRDKAGLSFAKTTVVDLVTTPGNVLDKIRPQPEFVQQSVDGEKLPFPSQSFDLVTCNHVLEHIFHTEDLVREIRRVVRPDGLVVISVPNVAAWMNRILFLFGCQPLGTEVGTESISYGFWPGFLKARLGKFVPAGHVRAFTPRGLRDLAAACGLKQAGWWLQEGGFCPTLTRNLGMQFTPLPLESEK